jgi:ABC-type oligopeptide transport system substrate-binding subunit
VAACGGGSGGSQNTNLAASQVLHFPVYQPPETWDPGEADAEVDTELMQNVYDNLWRFDNSLNIVPDIATDVPSTSNGGISSDGKTYTIHLNSAAKFNNGDSLTCTDVLYSWSRSIDLQGPYASNLSAIAGYKAAQTAAGTNPANNNGTTTQQSTFQGNIETNLAAQIPSGSGSFIPSGLKCTDPETFQVTLASGCGWCLTAWTLEGSTGAIVDEKAIKNDPVSWWQKPVTPGCTDCMAGAGAFYLSSFNANQGYVFKAVSNWWGSPKPTLTEVDILVHDPSAIATDVTAFEQGHYDLIGYGGNSGNLTYPLIQAIKGSRFSGDLLTQPKGRTTWVSFNIGYTSTGGPFVGESAAAQGLRMAFDLAVDKNGLASTVCHNVQCSAATGGLITKGLIGYLGDNADPLAQYNPTKAKQLLQQYDPTGSLTANLKYSYNTGGLNDPVAQYLQNEWQSNLGVHVTLDPDSNASDFINNRLTGKYVMSRDGWQFDYNHPQDWFDNLWGAKATAAGANTSGFDDPTYDSILAQADAEPLSQALPLYNQLSQILQKDVVYIPLYYSVGNFVLAPYVKGAGSNTAFDYYWNGISLVSH